MSLVCLTLVAPVPAHAPLKRAHARWRATALSAALALALATAAHADTPPLPLPDDAAVRGHLLQAPALAGAGHSLAAERAAARQLQAGDSGWTASASTARRALGQGAVPPRGQEWELGLERAWRLPGKAALADRLGQARVATAQAQQALRWREQARALLDQQLAWLAAREAAAVWASQVQLLTRQAQAVARRQQLGDAARIDGLQADAALAQARAQADQAQARALAEQRAMAERFGGLQPVDRPLPPPPTDAGAPAAATADDAALVAHPELQLAAQELQAAAAQAGVDAAERRGDPRIGWRIGTGPTAGERLVGVTLSLPLGSAQRDAGADASAARLRAAQAASDGVRLRLAADAVQRRLATQRLHALWQQQRAAADALGQVADGLARGYALGEGTLADVLQAQRLANEQRLAATLAAVDAWGAAWSQALEVGALWAPPAYASGADDPARWR
jgi:outer membrane protein TolC